MSFLSQEEQEYFAKRRAEIEDLRSYKNKWYERRADESYQEWQQRAIFAKQSEYVADGIGRVRAKQAEEIERQRKAREQKPALNWDDF